MIEKLEETTADEVLRQRDIKRLKKRRDFAGHLLVYFLVNTFIVLIWFMSGSNEFFWRYSRSWDGASAS